VSNGSASLVWACIEVTLVVVGPGADEGMGSFAAMALLTLAMTRSAVSAARMQQTDHDTRSSGV
jgi:hypothetical protein